MALRLFLLGSRRWGLPGYAQKPTKEDAAVQRLEASINNCAHALTAWRQQQLTAQRATKHKQLEAVVNAAARRVCINAKGDEPEPTSILRDEIGLPEKGDGPRARILGK